MTVPRPRIDAALTEQHHLRRFGEGMDYWSFPTGAAGTGCILVASLHGDRIALRGVAAGERFTATTRSQRGRCSRSPPTPSAIDGRAPRRSAARVYNQSCAAAATRSNARTTRTLALYRPLF
jgi:hypothetical protein